MDRSAVIVYPHAPSARRAIRNADALLFHVRTASAPCIRAFTEECAPFIARIQRALPQPPTDGAEEINPAAEAMTAIAERKGL